MGNKVVDPRTGIVIDQDEAMARATATAPKPQPPPDYENNWRAKNAAFPLQQVTVLKQPTDHIGPPIIVDSRSEADRLKDPVNMLKRIEQLERKDEELEQIVLQLQNQVRVLERHASKEKNFEPTA